MNKEIKKKFFSTKLAVNLLGVNALVISVAIILFLFLNSIGSQLVNMYFTKTSYLSEKRLEAMREFQSYVSENNISIKDFEKIDSWAKSHKYLEIYIFKDNVLIYDSSFRKNINKYTEIVEETNISAYYNSVSFEYQDAYIYIDYYIEYQFYSITTYIAAIISIIVFNLLMLYYVNKKIRCIKKLEEEIKILEGGDLNYEITIDGDDEITSLAQSIDDMRKSFIERLENEDMAKSANTDLITAISHDLRTPLTALVGYLDIIKYKKYKNEEELMKYIHNCREKAYQIKYMSDKLFEYFLVFSTQYEMNHEKYNGNELLEQIIEEHVFRLSAKKFIFDIKSCNKQFSFDINLLLIRRVFDNIFSNIFKYADNTKLIQINSYIENNILVITIKNSIKQDLKDVSSTRIGMKTCKKIIEMHKGQYFIASTDTYFKIIIMLPVYT